MADIKRNDETPVVAAEGKEVPMPEGTVKAPQIQVTVGNTDLVQIKLLEAINNNIIQLKNAILEKQKNG